MADYKQLFESVDKHRDLIFAAEEYIWNHPETGYREWKTSAYLEKGFEKFLPTDEIIHSKPFKKILFACLKKAFNENHSNPA